jgi:uncharacterized protein YbaP (TraB family)
MNKLLLAAAMAFAPATAFAQAAPAAPPAPAASAPAAAPLPDADPALWVVRDDDTTIYLFGTFHLLDGRPWFNDEVKTAFDASSELIMEAIPPEDIASLQPMVMRYAVDPNGRTLSSRLNAEQNAQLAAALRPLPATAFDRFEPWFVSMTLGVLAAQKLGADAANGPETVLTAAARARNMRIGELEGFEWQIRLFDTMPEEQQISGLIEVLEENDQLDEKMAPMLAAWSTGDVERLGALMTEGDDDPAFHRMIFTDRNLNWAGRIQERLAQPGIVFIAVGAGHLAGPDSVQAALQARGIRSQRVPHLEAN